MDAVEEVQAGIDWFSATMHIEEGDCDKWRQRAMEQLRAVISDGNRVEATKLYGYDGFMSHGCFVGSSTDRIFVQFAGAYADVAFGQLYHASAHIARIDLQVTAKLKTYNPSIAQEAYNGAEIVNRDLPAGRRRKLLLYGGNDGGGTCYIGSPTSEQRGRIYNKEVQSEDPQYERCWRYEIVLRNKHAMEGAKALWARREYIRAAICDAVAIWFASRGTVTPWSVRDRDNALPRVRRDATDSERQLWWLAKQVRPVVLALVAQGFEDVVQSILFGNGSWDFPAPSRKTK